jgi:hypothetical protein
VSAHSKSTGYERKGKEANTHPCTAVNSPKPRKAKAPLRNAKSAMKTAGLRRAAYLGVQGLGR